MFSKLTKRQKIIAAICLPGLFWIYLVIGAKACRVSASLHTNVLLIWMVIGLITVLPLIIKSSRLWPRIMINQDKEEAKRYLLLQVGAIAITTIFLVTGVLLMFSCPDLLNWAPHFLYNFNI